MPNNNLSSAKAQPWKKGWIARNSLGVKKQPPKGTTHGTKEGERLIQGGHTFGIPIKIVPAEAQ
ncbi:hypothetical protein B0H65DRAFT_427010 [Neurospora tetraspora]|uniref:Uncharacterized protein n=1 Tax=Neurospora tetraspora TaxID=94610 RepID=A0AAE0JEU9_9PEZI|nr:hypothetical protein B0H65DRAFT_427010 [Neurospora tetraspora]